MEYSVLLQPLKTTSNPTYSIIVFVPNIFMSIVLQLLKFGWFLILAYLIALLNFHLWRNALSTQFLGEVSSAMGLTANNRQSFSNLNTYQIHVMEKISSDDQKRKLNNLPHNSSNKDFQSSASTHSNTTFLGSEHYRRIDSTYTNLSDEIQKRNNASEQSNPVNSEQLKKLLSDLKDIRSVEKKMNKEKHTLNAEISTTDTSRRFSRERRSLLDKHHIDFEALAKKDLDDFMKNTEGSSSSSKRRMLSRAKILDGSDRDEENTSSSDSSESSEIDQMFKRSTK